MESALMRRRMADARAARLATVTPGGDPHIVPCCFALDGDVIWTAVDDAKPKATLRLQRLVNLAARPRASLLVDHYDEDWTQLWWVRADGHGRVAEPGDPEQAEAVRLLAAKYPQYRRHPPPGPAVIIEIAAWRAWP